MVAKHVHATVFTRLFQLTRAGLGAGLPGRQSPSTPLPEHERGECPEGDI